MSIPTECGTRTLDRVEVNDKRGMCNKANISLIISFSYAIVTNGLVARGPHTIRTCCDAQDLQWYNHKSNNNTCDEFSWCKNHTTNPQDLEVFHSRAHSPWRHRQHVTWYIPGTWQTRLQEEQRYQQEGSKSKQSSHINLFLIEAGIGLWHNSHRLSTFISLRYPVRSRRTKPSL